MSNQLDRAERYGCMANESLRLAANDPYTESQNFHLRMAELYSALAEAAELKTTRGRKPMRQVRPNGRRLGNAAYSEAEGTPGMSHSPRTPQRVATGQGLDP